ncbi:unnamed protein product [Calypogeia fissa]
MQASSLVEKYVLQDMEEEVESDIARDLLKDKEALMNAVAASKDAHTLKLDSTTSALGSFIPWQFECKQLGRNQVKYMWHRVLEMGTKPGLVQSCAQVDPLTQFRTDFLFQLQ